MTTRRAGAACLLVVVGCGSEDGAGQAPPTEGDCPAPNRVVNERCLEPGVQDDGCPAGTRGDGAGGCLPPGALAEACAEGFVHDGDGRCEPILPAEPCPYGLMATPGDSACHPVLACGVGKWGDIPVDGTTVYVDAAYGGGSSDGTESQPYTSLVDAVAAAPVGALIAIAEGTYVGDVVLTKTLRLWGVCPERVVVVGTGGIAAVDLRTGAGESEIRGLSITGTGAAGVAITGSEDVVVSHIWVRDGTGRGIATQNDLGSASVTLTDSLFEGNTATGVLFVGADGVVERVVVRDTQSKPQDLTLGQGMGIRAHPISGTVANVAVTSTVLERNHRAGLYVVGANATLTGMVIRDTQSDASTVQAGFGANLQASLTAGTPAVVEITSSLFERNREAAILVEGSTASLAELTIRDTLPRENDLAVGNGVVAQLSPELLWPAATTLRNSVLERNHGTGIVVSGSEFIGSGFVVRDTQPDSTYQGRGMLLQRHPTEHSMTVATVSAAVVEGSRELGIFMLGVEASLSGVLVRGTLPNPGTLAYGRGIAMQPVPETNVPSTVSIHASVIEANHEFGLLVLGANAFLDGVVVRDTVASANLGLFGDGIAVVNQWAYATAQLHNSRVSHHARAGLGNFGATVTLDRTTLTCNQIDLGAEDYNGPFVFEDLGDNRCGCPESTDTCKAVSAQLTPPTAIEPPP